MTVFKKVLLHTVEFAVVLFAALSIMQFFGTIVTEETKTVLLAAIMAAFAKLGREIYGDFVNK
jgi:hypothetical protein